MNTIKIDTEVDNVKTTREIVVEPAKNSTAVAPANAIQYSGNLVSESNKFPVEVTFPQSQATSDPALGKAEDAAASSDSASVGLIPLAKRVLTRLTFLFQGTAGNPNANVITVQGITNGQSVIVADPAVGKAEDAAASSDSASVGLIPLAKRVLTRLTFLFQGTAGNPNANVITVQGITNGQSILVSAPPPDVVATGQRRVATAGTAILLGTAVGLTSGVTIKSLSGNTAEVFLRGINSTSSFELRPGESTIVFVSRLDALFVDAKVNGEGVSFHAS
jgi:hypothetical protein